MLRPVIEKVADFFYARFPGSRRISGVGEDVIRALEELQGNLLKERGEDDSSDLPDPALIYFWRTTAGHQIESRILDRGHLLSTAVEAQVKLEDKVAAALEGAALKKSDKKYNYDADAGARAGATQFRLAVTNLFVEKAQYHLEERADQYQKLGLTLYAVSVFCLACGTVLSIYKYLKLGSAADTRLALEWPELIFRFIVAFTSFGLVVLLAVTLAKGAKACYDQRERLLTRRHSLRQGRLFLHLNAGLCSVEEMQKVFDWNNSQTNSFTDLNVDAKAPWGNVVQELVKIIPDLVKTGVEAAGKGRSYAAAESPEAARE